MNEPAHIFVYGTLRSGSGHPMARRLTSQARLLGKGSVPGRLYDMGWYPAALFDRDEKHLIVGDVFALAPDSRLNAGPIFTGNTSRRPGGTRATLMSTVLHSARLRAYVFLV